MSVLDDVFLFFNTPPHTGFMWATLTSIQRVPPVPPTLPGAIATASGVLVTWAGGPTPTISFDVAFKYKTLGGPLPTIKVILTQNPGAVYSMDIPAIPLSCPNVNIDNASHVTYASQAPHFVTLALKHGPQG